MRLVCLWMVAVSAMGVPTAPEACARCHRAETAAFAASGMAQALMPAQKSAVLPQSAKIGAYSYEVEGGAAPTLAVSDGRDTLRVPIEWAFGHGTVGQTYVFRREGRWYESRVSYFASLRGLGLTIGHQNITPHNLLEAAGRPMGSAEVRRCFDCHATGIPKSGAFDIAAVTAGVQCERCHGAAETHLTRQAAMKKLGTLGTEEMSEFCGQCHRTWAQIAADGPRGIANIRFQPYRLANSKCYDTADRRIRCTACHDPHRAVETSAAAYDAKCTACHARGAVPATKASARICKVAAKGCVTCHMPKSYLAEAHSYFTDHRIRVVRTGEGYPD